MAVHVVKTLAVASLVSLVSSSVEESFVVELKLSLLAGKNS